MVFLWLLAFGPLKSLIGEWADTRDVTNAMELLKRSEASKKDVSMWKSKNKKRRGILEIEVSVVLEQSFC